jgi:hypothetical protein
MDQLKNFAGNLGSGSGNQANNNAAAGGQQEDYLDKGKCEFCFFSIALLGRGDI